MLCVLFDDVNGMYQIQTNLHISWIIYAYMYIEMYALLKQFSINRFNLKFLNLKKSKLFEMKCVANYEFNYE